MYTYKIIENEDGTTSISSKVTGEILHTFKERGKVQNSQPLCPSILGTNNFINKEANKEEKKIVSSSQAKKKPQQTKLLNNIKKRDNIKTNNIKKRDNIKIMMKPSTSVTYLSERRNGVSVQPTRSHVVVPDTPTPDYTDECITAEQFMQSLGLIKMSKLANSTPDELLQTFPMRNISRLKPEEEGKDLLDRDIGIQCRRSAFRGTYEVPFDAFSEAGKKWIKKKGFFQSHAAKDALAKYSPHCRTTNMPPYDRKKTYSITYRKRKASQDSQKSTSDDLFQDEKEDDDYEFWQSYIRCQQLGRRNSLKRNTKRKKVPKSDSELASLHACKSFSIILELLTDEQIEQFQAESRNLLAASSTPSVHPPNASSATIISESSIVKTNEVGEHSSTPPDSKQKEIPVIQADDDIIFLSSCTREPSQTEKANTSNSSNQVVVVSMPMKPTEQRTSTMKKVTMERDCPTKFSLEAVNSNLSVINVHPALEITPINKPLGLLTGVTEPNCPDSSKKSTQELTYGAGETVQHVPEVSVTKPIQVDLEKSYAVHLLQNLIQQPSDKSVQSKVVDVDVQKGTEKLEQVLPHMTIKSACTEKVSATSKSGSAPKIFILPASKSVIPELVDKRNAQLGLIVSPLIPHKNAQANVDSNCPDQKEPKQLPLKELVQKKTNSSVCYGLFMPAARDGDKMKCVPRILSHPKPHPVEQPTVSEDRKDFCDWLSKYKKTSAVAPKLHLAAAPKQPFGQCLKTVPVNSVESKKTEEMKSDSKQLAPPMKKPSAEQMSQRENVKQNLTLTLAPSKAFCIKTVGQTKKLVECLISAPLKPLPKEKFSSISSKPYTNKSVSIFAIPSLPLGKRKTENPVSSSIDERTSKLQKDSLESSLSANSGKGNLKGPQLENNETPSKKPVITSIALKERQSITQLLKDVEVIPKCTTPIEKIGDDSAKISANAEVPHLDVAPVKSCLTKSVPNTCLSVSNAPKIGMPLTLTKPTNVKRVVPLVKASGAKISSTLLKFDLSASLLDMHKDAVSKTQTNRFKMRKNIVTLHNNGQYRNGNHLSLEKIKSTSKSLQNGSPSALFHYSGNSNINVCSSSQVKSKLTTLSADFITAIGSPTDCIPNQVIPLPWRQPVAKKNVSDVEAKTRDGLKRKLTSAFDARRKCTVTLSDVKNQLEPRSDSCYVKGSSIKVYLCPTHQKALKLTPVQTQSNADKSSAVLSDHDYHCVKGLQNSSVEGESTILKETDTSDSNMLQSGRYKNFLENNRYLFSDCKSKKTIVLQKEVPCIDLTADDIDSTEKPLSVEQDVPKFYVFHCFGCNQSKRFHSKKEVETITYLHLVKFHCISEPESYIKRVFDKETSILRFETFPAFKR